MKREIGLVLVGILVLISINFISAELGYNTRDSGVRNINQNVSQSFFTVNGSNINASSFSTQCSGTDKVINVTYSNFTGLFTVVCDTDDVSAGGLDWEDIINGTVYLSNNTYGFYNSTTLPTGITWANIINGTVYLSNNTYSFFNATSFPNYANIYLNTSNQFNYTNFTLLSQFTNDLTFYVDNTHSYWNDTYATFNKTYADTLYYSISNPSSFITLAQYFSNATTEFYPRTSNPFSYLNTTTDSFAGNYSAFQQHITWANATNGTLALNSSLAGYYPLANPFGFINTSTTYTHLSNFTNNLGFFNATSFPNYANVYLNTSNQYGYYNSTNFVITDYRLNSNHTFNGATTFNDNANTTGNNITNINFTTFYRGSNCWNMYVNESDWFIIEAC